MFGALPKGMRLLLTRTNHEPKDGHRGCLKGRLCSPGSNEPRTLPGPEMPTTHVIFEALDTERPAETSCPAASAPGRVSPHSRGYQLSSGHPLPNSNRLCPRWSPIQGTFKVEAFLHHQCLTLCQEIMVKEEKREGGEDARTKESLSSSRSLALGVSVGSCLHTRAAPISP